MRTVWDAILWVAGATKPEAGRAARAWAALRAGACDAAAVLWLMALAKALGIL